MATNDHARLLKAYLEDACDQLERRRRIVRSWRVWLAGAAVTGAAAAFAVVGCGSQSLYGIPIDVEICDDGKDNDENGLVDCDDPACETASNCVGQPLYAAPMEVCDDGKDNDGDGLLDC